MSEVLVPAAETPQEQPPIGERGGFWYGIRERMAKRYAAGLLVASAALGSMVLQPTPPERPAITHPVNRPLPPLTKQSCDPVPTASFNAMQALLNQPQSPIIKSTEAQMILKPSRQYSSFIGPIKPNQYIEGTDRIKQADIAYVISKQAADAYNLHVYDPVPYLMDIGAENMNTMQTNQPFQVYYEAANRYLANFGVTLNFDNHGEPYGYDLHAPMRKELENDIAKSEMLTLIQTFVTLPKEYIQLTGLKEIRYSSPGPLSYANVSGDHSSIVISLGATPDVYYHELWHLADTAMCGGFTAAQNDPDYTRHNAGDLYRQNTTAAFSETDFYAQRHALDKAFEQAVANNDIERAKDIWKQLLAVATAKERPKIQEEK